MIEVLDIKDTCKDGSCDFKRVDIETQCIEIKYLSPNVYRLQVIANGDWIDLRTAKDVALARGEYRAIPLGIAMKLPTGFEALVIPRSSTFNKFGVLQANSVGLIDESYCGNNDEWHFPVYATRDVLIPENTRICQFRIIKHQPLLKFIEVENMTSPDRGGFGSTGER